ncbi:MAG TPA: DUF4124 domain-containing protein [Gammaproteobacteria bacterium]|nr:DUF4124 domain-containing protein [Gammaproteobacteria bacterium]
MQRWLILLTALVSGTAGAVTIWKWVDKSGEPHYTDRPVPGAQRIELTGVPEVPALGASGAAASSSAASGQTASAYRRLVILKPEPQQTLWNIGGNLSVQVDVAPPLTAGDSIDVFLDGQRVDVQAASPQFTVPNVFRGVHTMQAVVVDAQGEEVLRSMPVTFMVQQTSVLNPNNNTPPAVRRRAAGS